MKFSIDFQNQNRLGAEKRVSIKMIFLLELFFYSNSFFFDHRKRSWCCFGWSWLTPCLVLGTSKCLFHKVSSGIPHTLQKVQLVQDLIGVRDMFWRKWLGDEQNTNMIIRVSWMQFMSIWQSRKCQLHSRFCRFWRTGTSVTWCL